MMNFSPIEWLSLQRQFFRNPKKGLAYLENGGAPSKIFLEEAKRDWERMGLMGARLISWESADYPLSLRNIYDPPLVLLVNGHWPVRWEERPWVAVVGARKLTPFGKEKTGEVVRDLVSKGAGIISGLAYGIDGKAHQACVESGGATWGVLGTGIDQIYPRQHSELARKMKEYGGFLSEFPLGTSPLAANFPQRNRIISGISNAVIVVEAALKSGSLITARFAMEQGKEVFILPPPKEHVAYEGTKQLLDDGATPYENAAEVIEIIRVQKEKKADRQPKRVSKKQRGEPAKIEMAGLLAHLEKPRTLDYLMQKTEKSAGELLSELIHLESEKKIRRLPGALWKNLSS